MEIIDNARGVTMNDKEGANKMPNISDVSTATGIAATGFDVASSGIVSRLLDRKYLPEQRANEFLSAQAIANGCITDDDIEKAALIYGSYKLKKQYVNIYKAKRKADALIQGKDVEGSASIDEDWFSAYEDHVSKISDESILDMWAAILAGEVIRNGTFRKIMLDRFSLLDQPSVKAFTALCQRTFTLNISDGRSYKIPFFIGETELGEMDKFDISKLTHDEKTEYFYDLPSESELQILEEIGLISLAEDFEDTDILAERNITFSVNVGNCSFTPFSIVRKETEYYHTLWNGSVVFTSIGLHLYNIIGHQYQPGNYLFSIIQKYNHYIEKASQLQTKNEQHPFSRLRNLFRT